MSNVEKTRGCEQELKEMRMAETQSLKGRNLLCP